MYSNKGQTHYQPISWEDAFAKISEKLRSLSSPHKAAFYTSGRTSNEAAFLYQAFVRMYGTNNLPDCSNMCHESSGMALISTIGIGKGTVSLADFNVADTILVIGQNPGTNHPRMLTALRDAKENGANIIHINPLTETGLVRFKHPQDYMKLNFSSTKLSDIHIPIKIGGDAALFQAVNKIIIESGKIDEKFIENKTKNYAQYQESLRNLDWQRVTQDTGVSRVEIEEVAELLLNSKSIISCWAMGLTPVSYTHLTLPTKA